MHLNFKLFYKDTHLILINYHDIDIMLNGICLFHDRAKYNTW